MCVSVSIGICIRGCLCLLIIKGTVQIIRIRASLCKGNIMKWNGSVWILADVFIRQTSQKNENYLHVVEEYFRCILLSQKTFEQFEIFRWHFHVLLSLLQAQLTPYVKTSPRRMKGKLVSNFFIHFSIQDFSNSRKDQILNWQNFKLDICTCTLQAGV